jgi:hypothetical protein
MVLLLIYLNVATARPVLFESYLRVSLQTFTPGRPGADLRT